RRTSREVLDEDARRTARFVPAENDALAVRMESPERPARVVDRVFRERLRLSGSGRQQHDLRGRRTDETGQDPLAVRGKRQGLSFSKANRRRGVESAQIHRVPGSSGLSLLGEDGRLAVVGEKG